jgi:uncharacterized protein (DUF58 family)
VLTSRGTGLIATAVVLWVVARTLGVGELQMAAVAALLLVAGAALFTATTSARLGVDRVVRPATLSHDAQATVALTLTNTGRLPTARVELVDGVPLALADRPRVRLEPLAPGARVSVTYQLHGSQRGRFTIGPLDVRFRDPFGLVARRRTLPSTATVTVHPPVQELPPGLHLGGSTVTAGRGRSHPAPSGDDLADVREYVRGDDLRSVHWPTTAHRGRLMVRQAESRQEPRAVLILDVRADRHRGTGPTASIETAVAAAASAGYHLASRGRSVVLLDRPMTGPPPATAWESWLELLADTRPEPVDLGGLLHQVGQGLAGDGTLVMVTTVPDATELRRVVRAGRGFSMRIALLVDAASHDERGGAAGDAEAAAAALRVAGWRVTVLRRGDRIDERWRDLLVHRRLTAGTVS